MKLRIAAVNKAFEKTMKLRNELIEDFRILHEQEKKAEKKNKDKPEEKKEESTDDDKKTND